MKLTDKQEQAVENIRDWWSDGPSASEPFILQGYAGTGKTTVMKECLAQLTGATPALVAPTGKAARVLERKTSVAASTIHRLIYKPISGEIKKLKDELSSLLGVDEAGRSDFENSRIEEILEKLRDLRREDAKFMMRNMEEYPDVIIVDEASMLSKKIATDLFSLGIPMIWVGDPFQLPPVKAAAAWDNMEPDIVLTEVVRQSGAGSGIALCAERIRLGQQPRAGEGMVLAPARSLSAEAALSADAIIVQRHTKRHEINKWIRKTRGYTNPLPEIGERVVTMTNDYANNIFNGEILTVVGHDYVNKHSIALSLKDDYDRDITVLTWAPYFSDNNDKTVPSEYHYFAYAYALTCHKAQGSEFGRVIVAEQSGFGDGDRWLYTAITRAVDHCTLIG